MGKLYVVQTIPAMQEALCRMFSEAGLEVVDPQAGDGLENMLADEVEPIAVVASNMSGGSHGYGKFIARQVAKHAHTSTLTIVFSSMSPDRSELPTDTERHRVMIVKKNDLPANVSEIVGVVNRFFGECGPQRVLK